MVENPTHGPVADMKLRVHLTLKTRMLKENGQIQSNTDLRGRICRKCWKHKLTIIYLADVS